MGSQSKKSTTAKSAQQATQGAVLLGKSLTTLAGGTVDAAFGTMGNAGGAVAGAGRNGVAATGAVFDATTSTVSRITSALLDAGRSAPLQSGVMVLIFALLAAMSSRGMAKRYDSGYAKFGKGRAFDQAFLLWALETFANTSTGMLYGVYHDAVLP